MQPINIYVFCWHQIEMVAQHTGLLHGQNQREATGRTVLLTFMASLHRWAQVLNPTVG